MDALGAIGLYNSIHIENLVRNKSMRNYNELGYKTVSC